MTFSNSVKVCFSKFTTWQGRASRSEYWYFLLFYLAVIIAAAVIDNVSGTAFTSPNYMTGEEQSVGYGYLYVLANLLLFLPGLSVLVRRLHDTNRTGWWYWLTLVPLVGIIVVVVWLCSKGTAGANNYGSDPLG